MQFIPQRWDEQSHHRAEGDEIVDVLPPLHASEEDEPVGDDADGEKGDEGPAKGLDEFAFHAYLFAFDSIKRGGGHEKTPF
jgi:hypothetical protein